MKVNRQQVAASDWLIEWVIEAFMQTIRSDIKNEPSACLYDWVTESLICLIHCIIC